SRLREWLFALHAGDLSQRLDTDLYSAFQQINEDLNTFAHMLEAQSQKSEKQLREHTNYILSKNSSLSVLYRIASSINTLQQLEETFMAVMKMLINALSLKGATIRLRSGSKQMKCIATAGEVPQQVQMLTEEACLREALSPSPDCRVFPIKHHGTLLGFCFLYGCQVSFEQNDNRQEEFNELLASVTDSLAVAIVKDRLNQQNKNLLVVKERAWIAHELHDSLAQTISSLRFKTRVLDQALHEGNESMIWHQLEGLETAIELANKEVRGLIRHFRDEHSPQKNRLPVPNSLPYVVAVEQCIEKFQSEHVADVFLQNECQAVALPEHHTQEVLRIIQEALNNASKHGKADHIRVVLRDNGQGNFFVLIEDNGCGIDNLSEAMVKPNHFGLNLMQECAKRISGTLQIESEKDEGVQVTLEFFCKQG
ncbi:MAG: ATP-binding protein, partial [Candidatus Oxydemutatoraceae bacterium WSBS_2016_MAG_OTU14]